MSTDGRYDVSGLSETQFEPSSDGAVLKNLLGIISPAEMDVAEASFGGGGGSSGEIIRRGASFYGSRYLRVSSPVVEWHLYLGGRVSASEREQG